MKWSDIGSAVGKAVPVVGGLLGGKTGEMMGNIVAGVLGVDPDPDTVLKRIQEDPEATAKLQKYEYDHVEELQRLQLQETQAYLQDVQSARSREVAMTQATGKKDWNLTGLAWLMTVGFLGVTFMLMFVTLPEDSNGVVMMLFGSLATSFGSVINYFFGSSVGSKNKDQVIANGKK